MQLFIKKNKMNSYIKYIGSYLPGKPLNNKEFIGMYNNKLLSSEIVSILFGGKQRYFANGMQSSDLAVNAALKFLKKEDKAKIDLLMFASASADLIEPATANIVQKKLGLSCPVFDIKNACNSFLSAMEIANSFISNGTYQNILIVSGEKPSDTIRFDLKDKQELKSNIASVSFGDGGAAVWMTSTNEKKGIEYIKFLSMGKFWNLSTVLGGGSMYPFDSDKNYFHGETAKLINVLGDSEARQFAIDCFEDGPWEKDEIDLLITHQVATHFYKSLAETINFPLEKIYKTFHKYANTASTAIPIALHDAIESGAVDKGDKIMLLGVAAGVSISVVFLTI